jgi:hypothetical protein
MKTSLINLIRKNVRWITHQVLAAIALGCIGVTLSLTAAIIVTLWGNQFLPLDYEGKITMGAAVITLMPILIVAFISAIIAGVPTLCAWRSLPYRVRAAGMSPATLILIIWLLLISFTGM